MTTKIRPEFCDKSLVIICFGIVLGSFSLTLILNRAFPDTLKVGITSDYKNYYEPVALNLIQGNGFIRNHQAATANPPGYSIITAALLTISVLIDIDSSLCFTMFNAVCLSISALLLFLLAHRLWGERSTVIVAITWATYPGVIIATTGRMTEIPFFVVFFSAVIAIWYGIKAQPRYQLRWFTVAGCFIGVSMLIRLAAIGLVPIAIMVVILSLRRARLLCSVVILISSCIVVSPWIFTLYNLTGRIILLGTNDVPSVRDGLTFAIGKTYRSGVGFPAEIIDLQERLLNRKSQMDTLLNTMGAVYDEFVNAPATVTHLFLIKAVRSWYATDSGRYDHVMILVQIPYLTIIVFSIRRHWLRCFSSRGYLILILILVAYFWIQTILVLSILRYMVPVMGILFTLIPALVTSNTDSPNR